jgi:ribonuclease HI
MHPTIHFDPINCAHQHLKRHVADIVARSLSRSVSDARSAFRECKSIDLTTYHEAMSQHGRDEAIKLLRLQTGGYWTDCQQGAQFEGKDDPKCFHCGQSMHDVFHLWTCTHLENHRRKADEELSKAALSELPRNLLLGVPSHRCVDLEGNLHTITYNDESAHWDIDCLLDDGISADDHTKDAFVATGADTAKLDTQQLAYKFLGYLGSSPTPRVRRCLEQPPTLPNLFTDGSYLHPGLCLAHATFGSWQPDRKQEDATEEEQDFCAIIAGGDAERAPGLTMAGSIPGVFSSSTRAELAGVIAALAKPGALHLALDNKSVVDGLNTLILEGKRSKKPWSLQSDGDLWAIAEGALSARGAHSIAVTWTKGHATWQQILDGTCTTRNAIGNGFADAAADHGHDANAKRCEQLVLNHVAAGQKAYTKLIARFQKFAVAIIDADKQERKEKGFIPSGKSAQVQWLPIQLEAPSRPDCSAGYRLDLLSLPRSLEGEWNEVSIFFSRTLWCQRGQPTTWLELYALFRLWGG